MNKLIEIFLTIFGRIKIFKYPLWLAYDPTNYLVKAKHYKEAIKLLKPGDIIARGYNSYLDGLFIPGRYSHSGVIYKCNKNEQSVIHIMAPGVMITDIFDFLKCDRFLILRPKDEQLGQKASEIARSYLGKKYDFSFAEGDERLYCHELSRSCYPSLQIDKKVVSSLFKKEAYTIDSFIESKDFEIVYEFDPIKEQ